MTFQRKKLGATGETLAANLLQRQKLRILARNLRTKHGEIDILAADGRELVVVEVKTKTNRQFGSAIEMITPAKQSRLIRLCHELQMTHQVDSVRIDIVTVDDAQGTPQIRHYKNLIEFNG